VSNLAPKGRFEFGPTSNLKMYIAKIEKLKILYFIGFLLDKGLFEFIKSFVGRFG
jgi:hypothetical protein